MSDIPARLGAARRGSLGVRRVRVEVEWENGVTDYTTVGPASGVSVAKRRAGTTGPLRYHYTIAVYDVPAGADARSSAGSGLQGEVERLRAFVPGFAVYPELTDAAWLRARYVDERLTLAEVGALLTPPAPARYVAQAMARAGIARRRGNAATLRRARPASS